MEDYNFLLQAFVEPILGNKITYAKQLYHFGKICLGTKFRGVFMADQIPTDLNKLRKYAIVNLDPHTEEGIHWIAIAFMKPNKVLIYDSFGKMNAVPQQILAIYPKSITTQPDVEQKVSEDNCGQRALAWLLVTECFGIHKAISIYDGVFFFGYCCVFSHFFFYSHC